MQFDPKHPFWATPEHAADRIENGWMLQCAGKGYWSRLIMLGTQGVHSHTAMLRKNQNGQSTVDVLELVCAGGRTKTLDYHIAKSCSRLDIFSPCRRGIFADVYDGKGAVDAMRQLCDYDYGWRGIFRMAIRRCPLLWRIYPPTTEDRLPKSGEPIRQPFCSHAFSLATQLGGHVDSVLRCPNSQVAPMDLTKSLFWEYEFTIITPWAKRVYGDQIKE